MSLSNAARAQARRLLGDPADPEEGYAFMPYGPREGWASVIALTLMMVVVALAIDDARWAGVISRTPNSQTGFLPFVAGFSVLLGTLMAKSRVSKLAGYLIGVLVGAGTLLLSVSSSISGAPSVLRRLHDLNLSVSSFVHDVFIIGQRSSETSVFLLVLGAVVWAAGIYCAFAVFRYQRPVAAIVVSGLILLINMSITIHDQYAHLVVFVIGALLLLVRMNVLQQIREWRQRDMGDLGDISATFMRNGAVFVGVAILAATLLAANASSAPLSRVWHGADSQLLALGSQVNRLLGGVSGPARGPNVLFTPTQTIRGVWQASDALVFTGQTSDSVGHRWRGATYDSFDGHSWEQLDATSYTQPAGANLTDGTADPPPNIAGTAQITATITPVDYGDDIYVAPGSPVAIDQPSQVVTSGSHGPLVEGQLSYGVIPGEPYTVTSVIDVATGATALTAGELASAGTNYPSWISRYLDIRPGSIGTGTTSVAQTIVTGLSRNQRDPFHIAAAMQDYLYRTGGFTYNTDVRGLCDSDLLVDCFLRVKQGYCEYFATAMVMMLRAVGVPARYAVGYLPGQRQGDGSWRVGRDAAHAWVQVFFPGYGWVDFDPTPGNAQNGQRPAEFAAGAPQPVPTPLGSAGPREQDCTDPLDPTCNKGNLPIPPITTTRGTPGVAAWVPISLAIGGLLLLLVVALLIVFRRLPRAEPELAYRGVASLAKRLGYGPKPSQTAYEFTAQLSELVPVARGDLQLIALAKVESTYGRRTPSASLLGNLARAYRRVRMGMLRLMFRRPLRRRAPHDEPPTPTGKVT